MKDFRTITEEEFNNLSLEERRALVSEAIDFYVASASDREKIFLTYAIEQASKIKLPTPEELGHDDMEGRPLEWGEIERLLTNYSREKENIEAQQIPGQLSIFDVEPEAVPLERPSKKEAEEKGAITTVGGYQTAITNPNYKHAFTNIKNDHAYMQNVGRDKIRDTFREEFVKEADAIEQEDQAPEEIDTALIREFFSVLHLCCKPGDFSEPVAIYLPSFCSEMNLRLNKNAEDAQQTAEEAEKNNRADFWGRLATFEDYIGRIGGSNGVVMSFINIEGMDKKNQILYVRFPYLRALIKAIHQDTSGVVTNAKGELTYRKPDYHYLLKSTVASERNKAAVEIANNLITGLMQRGTTPDAKLSQNRGKNFDENDSTVTYSISCQAIIDGVPFFKYRLDNFQTNETDKTKARKNIRSQQNRTLKNTFEAAFKILKTKTDVYKYYVDLQISAVYPTMKTLKSTDIVITHKGVNKKYKAIK